VAPLPANDTMIDDLYHIADELRVLANLGLHYSKDDYDRERYEKVLEKSARILQVIENRPASEILAEYRSNPDYLAPLSGAGAALFRANRLLLIRRHDDGLWALPGGAVEIGETTAAAAVRELKEETGIDGRATGLLAVFDSRTWQSPFRYQLNHFVFACETDDPTPHTSSEALDVGFFREDDLPPLSQGHHLRVPMIFRIRRGEIPAPYFDL
jgi:ADP-ribose pyrophosphatase YjhB (NUDIX family)